MLPKFTPEELAFLERKTHSALIHYEDGVPLKDVWDKDDDTIKLMQAFLYVNGWKDE